MCDTLRPREDGQIMWNLPALSTCARTMLECFIGLAHLTQAKNADEEYFERSYGTGKQNSRLLISCAAE